MADRAAIHCNISLQHQLEFARYLKQGLQRHGIAAEITVDVQQPADMHLVLGPHYAKRQWLGHPRTVLLDRCFWGHHRQQVSLGWMRPDGGRHIPPAPATLRHHPELCPMKTGNSIVYLADYQTAVPPGSYQEVRRHPTESGGLAGDSLAQVLARHQIAVGGMTTALISAALAGLKVVCNNPASPCWPLTAGRPRVIWLQDLAWMNWHHCQIASGEAIARLLETWTPPK